MRIPWEMSKYESLHTHIDTYIIEQNGVDFLVKFNKNVKKRKWVLLRNLKLVWWITKIPFAKRKNRYFLYFVSEGCGFFFGFLFPGRFICLQKYPFVFWKNSWKGNDSPYWNFYEIILPEIPFGHRKNTLLQKQICMHMLAENDVDLWDLFYLKIE